MNAREAFKAGFLGRCVEEGITSPDRICAVVKTATQKMASGGIGTYFGLEALGNIAHAAGEVGSTALGWGIPLAAVAPPVLGAMGGTLASKATDISDDDTGDVKRQEVIDEYKRQATRLRREGLLRRYAQDGTGRSAPSLL